MTDRSSPATLDPNQAPAEELATLPGIGEALAGRIVEGRPYQTVEDLLGVAGVGDGLLERIRPTLEIQPPETGEPLEADLEAEGGTGPAVTPARSSGAPGGIGRGGVLALDLVFGLLSALLGAGVTLGILLAINGTLNMGRHRQVRELGRSTAALQRDVEQLEGELQGLDRRLAALDGLTGRMSELEGGFGSVQRDVERALRNVEAMQESVDELKQTAEDLDGRVGRFDRFLEGLRRLLARPDPGEAESTPSP